MKTVRIASVRPIIVSWPLVRFGSFNPHPQLELPPPGAELYAGAETQQVCAGAALYLSAAAAAVIGSCVCRRIFTLHPTESRGRGQGSSNHQSAAEKTKFRVFQSNYACQSISLLNMHFLCCFDG